MPVVWAVAGYCLKMALKDVVAQSKHYIDCMQTSGREEQALRGMIAKLLYVSSYICRSVGGYPELTLQGRSVEGG